MKYTDTSPKVSIGLPVYNGADWLGDTLNSLLSQSYSNIELIISDNASTDNTEQLCKDYAAGDKRILYIRNEYNMGVTENYNNVYRRSKGKYFKWASASDLCDKEFIKKCVNVLETNENVVLCYPKTKLFVGDVNNCEEYSDNLYLQQEMSSERFIALLNNIKLNNLMNGVIRSNVLRKTCLHKNYLGSDINLMSELALYGKIVQISEFLFYRRMERDTATKLKSDIEVKRYFSPSNENKMIMQSWKKIFNLFLIANRVSFPISEKIEVYKFLLKKLAWSRGDLYKDISEAFKAKKM